MRAAITQYNQPSQSGLRLVKKSDQPNQPKTVFLQQNTEKPNQTEMVDPNRT